MFNVEETPEEVLAEVSAVRGTDIAIELTWLTSRGHHGTIGWNRQKAPLWLDADDIVAITGASVDI